MSHQQTDRLTETTLSEIFRNNDDARGYYTLYSDPTLVRYPFNTKVDQTLKQCRQTELSLFVPNIKASPQPPTISKSQQVQLARLSGVRKIQEHGITQWDTPKASLSFRDIEALRRSSTAHAHRPHRSMKNDRTESGKLYLTDDECPKIVSRIFHRMNRLAFGQSSRRKDDPYRFSVMACMHDVNTRRHFHMMFGRPTYMTEEQFIAIYDRAIENEPFIYDERVIKTLDTQKDVAQVMNYNIDPWKSRTGQPIIFVTHRRPPVVAHEVDPKELIRLKERAKSVLY